MGSNISSLSSNDSADTIDISECRASEIVEGLDTQSERVTSPEPEPFLNYLDHGAPTSPRGTLDCHRSRYAAKTEKSPDHSQSEAPNGSVRNAGRPQSPASTRFEEAKDPPESEVPEGSEDVIVSETGGSESNRTLVSELQWTPEWEVPPLSVQTYIELSQLEPTGFTEVIQGQPWRRSMADFIFVLLLAVYLSREGEAPPSPQVARR